MILDIIKAPDERLRGVSKDITKINHQTKIFIQNMLETMYHDNGIGLAAPQVGVLKRIITLT